MKRLFPALIAVILMLSASGCVSLGKHEELKNKNAATEKEIVQMKQKCLALESEIAQQREKNKDLAGEISQLRKGAEFHLTKGMEFYRLDDYNHAMEQFEKLADRYPSDPLAVEANIKIKEIKSLSSVNYHKLMKALDGLKDTKAKIDLIERETGDKFFTESDLEKLMVKKEHYLSDFKLQEDLNRHILIEDDPTQSLRIYRSTRTITQHFGDEKSFYVEFYVTHQYSGKRDIRIKTRYVGNKWISYDAVIFRGEGGQVEVICKYPEKLSNMANDRIYEWSDNDIDDEKLIKLSKSNAINVRFNGGYKYSFALDDEQILGLREMIRKYQSLK